MPEKVSSKIKRLETELSEEIGRSIELYSSIREQRELIDKFINYFVQENIAEDSQHAIRIVREYASSRDNPNQLSFDLQ